MGNTIKRDLAKALEEAVAASGSFQAGRHSGSSTLRVSLGDGRTDRDLFPAHRAERPPPPLGSGPCWLMSCKRKSVQPHRQTPCHWASHLIRVAGLDDHAGGMVHPVPLLICYRGR